MVMLMKAISSWWYTIDWSINFTFTFNFTSLSDHYSNFWDIYIWPYRITYQLQYSEYFHDHYILFYLSKNWVWINIWSPYIVLWSINPTTSQNYTLEWIISFWVTWWLIIKSNWTAVVNYVIDTTWDNIWTFYSNIFWPWPASTWFLVNILNASIKSYDSMWWLQYTILNDWLTWVLNTDNWTTVRSEYQTDLFPWRSLSWTDWLWLTELNTNIYNFI